jgi:aryl-alcohol dehydrogenase-like predicted oxidoreductase
VWESHGVSLRAAALQFPLTHPAVVMVCVGCRSPQEVADNVADFDVEIPRALWVDLSSAGLIRDAVPPDVDR